MYNWTLLSVACGLFNFASFFLHFARYLFAMALSFQIRLIQGVAHLFFHGAFCFMHCAFGFVFCAVFHVCSFVAHRAAGTLTASCVPKQEAEGALRRRS